MYSSLVYNPLKLFNRKPPYKNKLPIRRAEKQIGETSKLEAFFKAYNVKYDERYL